jgi:hypothetical protein
MLAIISGRDIMCGGKDNNQGCHYSICRTVYDHPGAADGMAGNVVAVAENVHELSRLLATLANSSVPDLFYLRLWKTG